LVHAGKETNVSGSGISGSIADINVHKPKLFELYQKCRFDEIASHALMAKNSRVEKLVRWTSLILILISFLTGSISYLNQPILSPVWAVVTALATVIGIYSLIIGSGAKQIHWFSVAARFRAEANEVEFFSEFVRLGKITEDELLNRWMRFSHRIEEILGSAGTELPEYCSANREKLDTELLRVLKAEAKL
jgi:hypothetical protein